MPAWTEYRDEYVIRRYRLIDFLTLQLNLLYENNDMFFCIVLRVSYLFIWIFTERKSIQSMEFINLFM